MLVAKSGASTTSINPPCPAEPTSIVAIVRRVAPSAATSSRSPFFSVTSIRRSGRNVIAQGASKSAITARANGVPATGVPLGEGDGLGVGAGAAGASAIGCTAAESSPLQAAAALSATAANARRYSNPSLLVHANFIQQIRVIGIVPPPRARRLRHW
ncbi:hypothetical protein SPHINGO8AM_40006 [Sphingomonas sp. 8AM]|nr:hypothetical protein SPHINGO8AM_40006 [Sphingomonas sp. 8AM]